MRTTTSITRAAFAVFLALACLGAGPRASQAYPHVQYPTPEDYKQQELIRQAGLNGDRSQIPMIVDALRKSQIDLTKVMAVHALAQMGAVEALPAMHVPPENFFLVQRARLLAESSVLPIKDGKARARQKIARFYQELALTPEQLGPAAELHESRSGPWSHPVIPLEVFAMREIADMVYHGSYKDFADLPGVALVDFQHDYPAWIKMKVAPLSSTERAAWLINDLGHKKAITSTGNEDCEMHLVAEIGTAAAPALVAQMGKMDANRAEYHEGGWLAMFALLGRVAPAQRDAIRAHFQNDADVDVAHAFDGGHMDFQAGY